jgi:hypothetical protein
LRLILFVYQCLKRNSFTILRREIGKVPTSTELRKLSPWGAQYARPAHLALTSGHQCNDCSCYFLAADG